MPTPTLRNATRSRVSRAIGMSAGLSLLAALALGAAGCGSDDEDSGPLSKAEKQYIQEMEGHQKSIEKHDAELTAGILTVKQQYPQGGAPTEVVNAGQEVLDVRRKLIATWDDTDCPSERFGELCDLWSDTLNAQYRWDDAVVTFLNKPYTDETFEATVEAGRKQTELWHRCQGEIKRLEREASGE
jgi:hypothetical protein